MSEEFLIMLKDKIKKEAIKQDKSVNDIIMNIYNKHINDIKEEDTNGIYYYAGTYMYVYSSWLESLGLKPSENLVPKNSPQAEFRKYQNIEGLFEYNLNLEEAAEFEKNHTIIFDNDSSHNHIRPFWITESFVIKAVKENQETAVKHILKKYKNNKRK